MLLYEQLKNEEDLNKNYKFYYAKIIYNLNNRIELEDTLETILLLDRKRKSPVQIYKTFVHSLKSSVTDLNIELVLYKWAELVLNHKNVDYFDDFFEFIQSIPDYKHFSRALDLLFEPFKFHFLKYFRELQKMDGLNEIKKELTREYESYMEKIKAKS